MLTPKDDPSILKEWKELEAHYKSMGLFRFQAHKIIASSYGTSRGTVFYWLTPEYKAEHDKKTSVLENKFYFNNTEALEKKRKRERNYSKLKRYLTLFLRKAIPQNKSLTIIKIRENLEDLTTVRLGIKTLNGLIEQCKNEDGDYALIKNPDGTYKLNPKYYGSIKKGSLPIIEKKKIY